MKNSMARMIEKTESSRREFIVYSSGILGGILYPSLYCQRKQGIPPYLYEYEDIYEKDSKTAALAWFKSAKRGLFIHYGLYSLLGRHEWVQYDERIPVGEYAKLRERFTAERFDADFITDVALEAGMKYINLVTKHCDGFCLWNTKYTDFNSINSPAKRDLVAEMAEACSRKGLGFFIFYEHGFDWRHPHGPSPWDWKNPAVRPHYDPPDPFYAYGNEYRFMNYLDYVTGHITELLTNYGLVAGVWLDGAAVPHSGDKSKFRLHELYALIRVLQPQTLISYKWGVTGDEDFLAPEEPQIRLMSEEDRLKKPVEICTSLHDGGTTPHPIGWGYVKDATHFSAEHIMGRLEVAKSLDANLLLNIGPMPDGSIHEADVRTLRDIAKVSRGRGI